MSRRWILPIAITTVLVAESLFATVAARADGGEALLERLLQDPAAQTTTRKTNTTQQTSSAPASTKSTDTARSKPRDAIRLTPDRTEVVRLEQDAASVVVTNPAHAQVMMETPRLLLVMPRTPGSTSLFVLDKNGATIFERDIIVSGASKPYVRIRKSCNSNDNNCNADSYFYCPDGCYEVETVPPSDNTAAPSIPSGPVSLDTTPVPSEIPPNAQSRSEPEPLPVMDDASGLDTESPLDQSAPQPDEQESTQ